MIFGFLKIEEKISHLEAFSRADLRSKRMGTRCRTETSLSKREATTTGSMPAFTGINLRRSDGTTLSVSGEESRMPTAGHRSIDPDIAHLRRYRPLFRQLRRYQFFYVATNWGRHQEAGELSALRQFHPH
jgi:hypothetical protein